MNISPLELGGFVSILSYSFFASLHCAFMCGPLVCGVLGPKAHAREWPLWTYNMARLVIYVLLGGILGMLVGSVGGDIGNALSYGLGGLLIAAGLSMLISRSPHIMIPRLVRPSQLILSKVATSRPAWRGVLLGIGTGFLPCMTLAPAYAMAAASGTTFSGSLFMLGFGLGTLPVMVIAPAMASRSLDKFPKGWTVAVSAAFLILAGAVTIWRTIHTH